MSLFAFVSSYEVGTFLGFGKEALSEIKAMKVCRLFLPSLSFHLLERVLVDALS